MSHPEDLLAEYVDGALADRDHAAVEAHLAGCERCRNEVVLAGASLAGLRRLPELAAPEGSASRALREAGVGGDRGRTRVAAAARPPRWARWVSAAAAAALIGLLVLTLPRLGDHAENARRNPFAASGGAEATGRPGTALGTTPGPSSADAQRRLNQTLAGGVQLEQRTQDYTAADIQQLTNDTASRYLGASIPTKFTAATPDASLRFGSAEPTGEARAAIACVSAQVTTTRTDALVELIHARFEGTPAYVAVFMESPSPGARANEVVIWVVRQDGCTIANFAYRKL